MRFYRRRGKWKRIEAEHFVEAKARATAAKSTMCRFHAVIHALDNFVFVFGKNDSFVDRPCRPMLWL